MPRGSEYGLRLTIARLQLVGLISANLMAWPDGRRGELSRAAGRAIVAVVLSPSLPSTAVRYWLLATALLVSSPVARAAEDSHVLTSSRRDGSAERGLSGDGLSAFADLVEQPNDEVLRRLQLDSTLVPLAVDAAEARTNRKHSAKLRMAIGFGMLGTAGLASVVLWSTAFTRAGDGYDVDVDRIIIAYVAAASAAVGLGVGVSGIVAVVRQSEAERKAIDRYRRPRTPETAPVAVRGHGLRVPLLSLSF